MFRFNRVYLLGSLLFSLGIPFVVVQVDYVEIPLPEKRTQIDLPSQQSIPSTFREPMASSTLNMWLGIYWVGVGGMGVRFLQNLLHLFFLIRTGKRESSMTDAWISHPKVSTSFSFFSYIFIPIAQQEDQDSFPLLLEHEQAHVQQWHSLDNLVVELIHCLCWFNPLIILYRKAIRLNHEFLADQAVLNKRVHFEAYFQLLYDTLTHRKMSSISSHFSYGQIQHRIIMMNKQSTSVQTLAKQLVLLPIFLVLGVVFGQSKTILTSIALDTVPKQTLVQISQDPDIIYELYSLDGGMCAFTLDPKGKRLGYRKIGEEKKYILACLNATHKVSFLNSRGEKVEKLVRDLSKEERERVWKLEQSQAQLYYEPVPEKRPSKGEWENFTDPSLYGVWLDGVRINNAELKDYTAADIHHYYSSRLMKNATNFGKHVYQVDLTTHKQVEKEYGPGGKGYWKPITLNGR